MLLLRPTCEACRQSLAFYKALSAKSKAIAGVRMMALSPDPIEAVRRWLADAEVVVDEVVQIRDPGTLGFTVYPTLLMTDMNGVVTDILVNRLTDAEQTTAWPRLTGTVSAIPLDNTAYPQEVSSTQLDDVLAVNRGRVQMVDIRDREMFAKGNAPGAINLPDPELATRARVELSKSDPVVIVCYPREATHCRISFGTMEEMQYATKVFGEVLGKAAPVAA